MQKKIINTGNRLITFDPKGAKSLYAINKDDIDTLLFINFKTQAAKVTTTIEKDYPTIIKEMQSIGIQNFPIAAVSIIGLHYYGKDEFIKFVQKNNKKFEKFFKY